MDYNIYKQTKQRYNCMNKKINANRCSGHIHIEVFTEGIDSFMYDMQIYLRIYTPNMPGGRSTHLYIYPADYPVYLVI